MNPKPSTNNKPAITLCPDPAKAPTRPNFIFVDYENIQPDDLSRIGDQDVRVIVVVGEKQTKVPIELVEFLQEKPGRLEMLKTPCRGKNALDFVLASEVGRVLAEEPRAYIHIISKDTGFDALVEHLKSKKHLAARHTSLDKVPVLFRTEERFANLVAHLRTSTKARPKKCTTLVNVIQQHFDRSLEPETVEKTIKLLIRDKVLRISNKGKIEYP